MALKKKKKSHGLAQLHESSGLEELAGFCKEQTVNTVNLADHTVQSSNISILGVAVSNKVLFMDTKSRISYHIHVSQNITFFSIIKKIYQPSSARRPSMQKQTHLAHGLALVV